MLVSVCLFVDSSFNNPSIFGVISESKDQLWKRDTSALQLPRNEYFVVKLSLSHFPPTSPHHSKLFNFFFGELISEHKYLMKGKFYI